MARKIDRGLELLTKAAEGALAERRLEQEILDRRETGRQRQFAGRLFLDIGFEDDAVGRAAFLALDLQIFLEIAKAVDAALGALDAEAVERVALVQTEFAEIGRASCRERVCL